LLHSRLRSQGLVDYHAVAALERVQAILRQLETQDWEYVPRLVEAQFYVRRPDARAVPGETVEKHRAGYLNAKTLTSTQTDIVQRLTMDRARVGIGFLLKMGKRKAPDFRLTLVLLN